MNNLVVTEKDFVDMVQSEYKTLFDVESKRVAELIVSNKSQYDNAIKEGASLKKKVKELDNKRKEFLAPLANLTKAINLFTKNVSEDVQPAIDKLLQRAAKWQSEENARLEAERRRIEQERRKEEDRLNRIRQEELAKLEAEKKVQQAEADIFGLEVDMSEIIEEQHDVIDGISELQKDANIRRAIDLRDVKDSTPKNVRKTWKFEIKDPSKVPAIFMIPDVQAIRAAVNGGARKIEGVEIYEHETIILR